MNKTYSLLQSLKDLSDNKLINLLELKMDNPPACEIGDKPLILIRHGFSLFNKETIYLKKIVGKEFKKDPNYMLIRTNPLYLDSALLDIGIK